MDREELRILNDQIASLHQDGDVSSLLIEPERRIKFPRGFLRTLNDWRGYLTFIADDELKDKIANHLMSRDTLHWLWLKTDIAANARQMLIKQQLINLGSIVEAIAVHRTLGLSKSQTKSVYDRLDSMRNRSLITQSICTQCKKLWESRKQVHLHLTQIDGNIDLNDVNYIFWHNALGGLMRELKEGI